MSTRFFTRTLTIAFAAALIVAGCAGGAETTNTPSPSASASESASASVSATETASATPSATEMASVSPSETPVATPSESPVAPEDTGVVHEPGTVTWVDLATSDLEGAKAFYTAVLGWTYVGGDDPAMMHYTTALAAEKAAAGMMARPEDAPYPIGWSVYLATDDADANAAAVTAAGGTTVEPPSDVADQGRLAAFADPTGAHYGVWQPKTHKGSLAAGHGGMAWHECMTRDGAAAVAFYTSVYGLTAEKVEMKDGSNYWMMKKGEQMAFGIMEMGEQFPAEIPAHWGVYFGVDNTDAAVTAAVEAGGRVDGEAFDTPYGRIAYLYDPFGARFGVVQPPATSGEGEGEGEPEGDGSEEGTGEPEGDGEGE